MKICISSEHATTNFGIGTHIQSLAIALKKRGHDVFLITNDHINENPSEMRIYQHSYSRLDRIPSKIKLLKELISFFIFISRVLIKERPDVIHSHSFYDFHLERFVASPLNIPLVNSHHSYVLGCPIFTRVKNGKMCECVDEIACHVDVPWGQLIRRMITRRIHVLFADAIVTLNNIEFSFFSKLCKNKTYFISNWVDIDFFSPKPVERDSKTIVFTGGARPFKHLDIVLRAFNRLQKRDPEYRLIVTGDMKPVTAGLWEPNIENYVAKLEAFIANNGLSEKIIFTGVVPKTEMPIIYSRAGVFVSASFTEINPIAFLEALACHTPVVAFVNPLNLDYCISSPKTLVDDIEKTLKSGLKEKTYLKIRREYSEDAIISRFISLYRGLNRRRHH